MLAFILTMQVAQAGCHAAQEAQNPDKIGLPLAPTVTGSTVHLGSSVYPRLPGSHSYIKVAMPKGEWYSLIFSMQPFFAKFAEMMHWCPYQTVCPVCGAEEI